MTSGKSVVSSFQGNLLGYHASEYAGHDDARQCFKLFSSWMFGEEEGVFSVDYQFLASQAFGSNFFVGFDLPPLIP